MCTEVWYLYVRCHRLKVANRSQEGWRRCNAGTEGNETACPSYDPTAIHDVVDVHELKVDHPLVNWTARQATKLTAKVVAKLPSNPQSRLS